MANTNPPSMTRRDALKAGGAAGLAALAGCYTEEDGQAVIGAPGGGPTVAGHFIFASSYSEAADVVEDRGTRPMVAYIPTGAVYTWGSGVIRMGDVTYDIGNAENYAEAKERVDTYPTVVITTNGNTWRFTE
jgi:hypothetical protein